MKVKLASTVASLSCISPSFKFWVELAFPYSHQCTEVSFNNELVSSNSSFLYFSNFFPPHFFSNFFSSSFFSQTFFSFFFSNIFLCLYFSNLKWWRNFFALIQDSKVPQSNFPPFFQIIKSNERKRYCWDFISGYCKICEPCKARDFTFLQLLRPRWFE